VRFKLDENLGRRGVRALREAAHDVATVADQKMQASSDVALIEVCTVENRCLVTLDLDFADPIRFPPAHFAGIVILRSPAIIAASGLEVLVQTLIAALVTSDPVGKLWVVEPGRVREHTNEE
jgi:predicted nuclease of predicted toxin-antitoxin system